MGLSMKLWEKMMTEKNDIIQVGVIVENRLPNTVRFKLTKHPEESGNNLCLEIDGNIKYWFSDIGEIKKLADFLDRNVGGSSIILKTQWKIESGGIIKSIEFDRTIVSIEDDKNPPHERVWKFFTEKNTTKDISFDIVEYYNLINQIKVFIKTVESEK